jgi:alkylmercury lyase
LKIRFSLSKEIGYGHDQTYGNGGSQMEPLSKNKIVESYRRIYKTIPKEALDLDLKVTIRTMQELSKGKPVSPDQLSKVWDMPLDQVKLILSGAVSAGKAEIDSDGNLVGGVLSLVPTNYRISMDNIDVFAWCAYDAIYAPGVLGKTAQIASTDPITGEPINITITLDGVIEVRPEETVVSVVGPETNTIGGRESIRCTQMVFFTSRESAHQWLQGRDDIAILSVEEVFEIAREFQIKPAKRLDLI